MFRHLLALVLATFSLAAFAAVDVNKASQAELETVKGIGPSLSAKILDARKSGPFKDWPDMVERVPGVGAGNAARFSEAGLTVGGAPYARSSDAKASAKSSAAPRPASSTTASATARATPPAR